MAVNRSALIVLIPFMGIFVVALIGVVLAQQKPPNITLLKLVFCISTIAISLTLTIGLLIGMRRYGGMEVIGLGWITMVSHPFAYRAVIVAILLLFAFPLVIGILTAIRVIPFSIEIDGQIYSDPHPATTPVEAP